MTSGEEWQDRVGRNWAETYALTDRSFAGLTAHFLDHLAKVPGAAVLDIGCGAGELSLAVAQARPGARVVGLDISADLVEAARRRAGVVTGLGAGGYGAGLEFVLGDAARWRGQNFAPDLLVSRHGVMFFADPVAAFVHLRGTAARGAHLAFTCFRDARLNGWASGLAALLPKDFATPDDPIAPGPFAFADAGRVGGILRDAGWQDVQCEPVDFTYVAGAGADPVADAERFFSRIGPAAGAMRNLPEAGREVLAGRMREWLAANRAGDEVRFAAAAWLVTARCH